MQHTSDARDRHLFQAAGQTAQRIARLASAYARAPPEQKELLLAEIEFQRWYLDTCRAGVRRAVR